MSSMERINAAAEKMLLARISKDSDFYEYIRDVGINVSGESYRITSKDINNYCFK